MDQDGFALTLTLQNGYAFAADFGLPGVPDLTLDEPPPLGAGLGPNPARLIAAAVGNCLAASLLFCLRRARIPVERLRATVEGSLLRNERGRLRIGAIQVRLAPDVAPEDRDRMGRCLELFEDFCVVTASVRQGIPIDVEVATEPVGAAAHGRALAHPRGRRTARRDAALRLENGRDVPPLRDRRRPRSRGRR